MESCERTLGISGTGGKAHSTLSVQSSLNASTSNALGSGILEQKVGIWWFTLEANRSAWNDPYNWEIVHFGDAIWRQGHKTFVHVESRP